MNPAKVRRSAVTRLTDLPNVGPAMAGDFERLGIRSPADLEGRDPLALYEALCKATRTRHDPCVLDVFMSVTGFMAGGEPRPWWEFTAERKRRFGAMAAARKGRAKRRR